MSDLLNLPSEIRIRILEHLFKSYIPDTFPSRPSKMAPLKPQPNRLNWLAQLHYCIAQNKLSPDPDAPPHWIKRGTHESRPCPTVIDSFSAIFTVNKLLRQDALDVWYSLALYILRENERKAKAFPSRYLLPAAKVKAYDDVAHILKRIRNLEVVFDVESARDMLQLPTRLQALFDALDLRRVLHLRVAIKFVRTQLRRDGWRVLATGGSSDVKQKSVGNGVWERFLREMEGSDLKRFVKKGTEQRHEIFVMGRWKVAEKGLDRFEELGRLIGAEVTSTNH